MGLKKYMLIRIGLDVRQEEWFGLGLTEESSGTGAGEPKSVPGRGISRETGKDGRGVLTAAENAGGRGKRRRFFPLRELLCHPGSMAAVGQQEKSGRFFGKMRHSGRRRGSEQVAPAKQQENVLRGREAIGKLAVQVMELSGEESRIFYVYEDSVRKWLTENRESDSWQEDMAQRQQKALPALWKQYFHQEEFADYCGLFWVEQILPQAVLPHFVVLGTAPCVFEILERYAGRMKSLRWILPEADCTEEVLEFVEDFYIEYGLAITIQQLPDAKEYGKLRFVCGTASNILDFAREPRAVGQGTAEGSIWLDMWSMEEKKHRIYRRNVKITYCSLKEKWKSAQRRCNCPVLP